MGAPDTGIEPAEQQAADALLSAFHGIGEDERRRHAAVLDYWLSIRGNREFPTIRELDPLQISDAGPCSLLLELIDSGEDASIRHIGENLKTDTELARIGEAPRHSLLACIAGKLAIIAISREPLAVEEEYESATGPARCRVTLLPFGSTGPWVDYAYAFVTSEGVSNQAETELGIAAEAAQDKPEDDMDQADPAITKMPADPVEDEPEPSPGDPVASTGPQEPALESAAAEPAARGFDPLAGVAGFFGNVVSVEVDPPATADTGERPEPSDPDPRSSLLEQLAQARAKADEAQRARQRSEAALVEGFAAAYDFALDAEDCAEDYLRLVEAQGLKIQLRSPMAPVVRLAFDGRCDEATILQLERVLAWALKLNLPRGSLAGRIEAEGGIAAIAEGPARA